MSEKYKQESTSIDSLKIIPAIHQLNNNKTTDKNIILNIPPRRMWGWLPNKCGYCGETSIQIAGLFFGQWVSSERIRFATLNKEYLIGYIRDYDISNQDLYLQTVVSSKNPQTLNKDNTNYELLIGTKTNTKTNSNTDITMDQHVCQTLGLVSNAFDGELDQFVNWIIQNIQNGSPVIHGFFINNYSPRNPDDVYDHIMPIIGFNKEDNSLYCHDLSTPYFTDTIEITSKNKLTKFLYCNSLKQINSNMPRKISATPKFRSETIDETSKNKPINELSYSYSISKNNNAPYSYATAIKGIIDPNNETKRTLLVASNINYVSNFSLDCPYYISPPPSEPDWGGENKVFDIPNDIIFDITIFDLVIGNNYAILRFDDHTKLEDNRNFISKEWSKRFNFKASSPNVTIKSFDKVKSDGEYFYRTVAI
jgi:hypothetical protein